MKNKPKAYDGVMLVEVLNVDGWSQICLVGRQGVVSINKAVPSCTAMRVNEGRKRCGE